MFWKRIMASLLPVVVAASACVAQLVDLEARGVLPGDTIPQLVLSAERVQVARVPEDYPTIAQAVAAVDSGGVVDIAPGVYFECGISTPFQVAISIEGRTGDPSDVIIDAGGNGPVFRAWGPVTFSGFTIRNGYYWGSGGAAILALKGGVTIRNCTFRNNEARFGGAVACVVQQESDVYTIADCLFDNNRSFADDNTAGLGGAVSSGYSAVVYLINDTFVRNRAVLGSAASAYYGGTLYIDKCLFSLNDESSPVVPYSGTVEISCTDIHGNLAGDWNPLDDQLGIRGNISEDPRFCNPAGGLFTLAFDSPCLPDNNECGVLMGSLGQGCPVGVPGLVVSRLLTCTPNPFNPATMIEYSVSKYERISIDILDLSGRRVARLIDGLVPAGVHRVVWRGRDGAGRMVPSGSYFVCLRGEGDVDIKKIVLVR